jgi:endonuclease/exonuclease/phosphatase family metal-dependent hydrolase
MRDPLVVASYNIHRGIGYSRRPDLDRIARVIAEIDPDVVALQEADSDPDEGAGPDPLVRLSEATGMTAFAGPTLRRHGCAYGNAILVRGTEARLRSVDLCVAGCEPRGALEAMVTLGSRTLRVIATHLGLRGWERRRQVASIVAAVGESGDPVVVAGDFNAWGPWRADLLPLKELFGGESRLPTFPSIAPVLALDKLWVRPAAALASLRVHRSAQARRASDHLPLVATLRRDRL